MGSDTSRSSKKKEKKSEAGPVIYIGPTLRAREFFLGRNTIYKDLPRRIKSATRRSKNLAALFIAVEKFSPALDQTPEMAAAVRAVRREFNQEA